mmetsp:Transcript_16106/g.26822  ORF Transcript_16106/g.26822 Transcript_16106/m.26822 type:complete len:94 (-) Transcript_16106:443-724(-)|eukprot:CAMPEP_0119312576 /NCGR_PEP_ID=MMETSP1333-20130426/26892_1 /TAXON_ID=418940 /ORGANISM="Scyphosphaera apsteinii, Strain RCC1455" /LENGTH=93 /DNA_ID=CAMNT_0007317221 /DNA_START=80 /DNA_END=361 /DNA_ORIENTATION=-
MRPDVPLPKPGYIARMRENQRKDVQQVMLDVQCPRSDASGCAEPFWGKPTGWGRSTGWAAPTGWGSSAGWAAPIGWGASAWEVQTGKAGAAQS